MQAMEVAIENVSTLVTEPGVVPTLNVLLSTTDLSASVLPSMLVTQISLLDAPRLNVRRTLTVVETRYAKLSTIGVLMLAVKLAVEEAHVLQRTTNQHADVSLDTFSPTTDVLILMNARIVHVSQQLSV